MATPEQRAEIRAALDDARKASGENRRALYARAEELMTKYHAAEEPGPMDDDSPAEGNNDVLTAAIGMAQEAGDTATVAKLKALADKPDELAALLGQLQGAPAK